MESCTRCSQSGDPIPASRLLFLGSPLKEQMAGSICAACWKQWEEVEVKVINEYRLNFMDPEHRAMLKRTCSEFFQLTL